MTKECVKSTCPYCGVGCGVKASLNQVVGDETHPANYGSLCVKGSALKESLAMPERLLYPRMNGKAVEWQSATQTIAQRIFEAINLHGPDSVAMYVSGQLLTEDYYAANKLMKGYVGSANIDTNSRLCMSSAVAAHVRAFGEDVVPVSYDDINKTDLLVLVGANTAWTHPILFKRIQLARKENPELKLVVIDPRNTMTAQQADLYLPIPNDGDVLLYNGLMRYLLDHDQTDYEFINHHTNGFAELAGELDDSRYQLGQVALQLDLAVEQLEQFYRYFAQSKTALTLFCQGVNQSESGVDKGNAIINAHLLSGKINQPGSGPFSLTGQPNAMGGREVGGLANQLAVHRGFDADSIAEVQQFWQSPVIASQPGLKAVQLFEAVERGEIKVLWIMATNPVVSMPDSDQVRRALEKCDFVIVSDITAQSDVAEYADMLLPAAGWGEKQGMVTNSERRISRQRRFSNLPGFVQPDWWAISQVGSQLCKLLGIDDGFAYQSENDLFREYAALSGINKNSSLKLDLSSFATISDQQLAEWQPTQWPLDQRLPFSDNQFSTPSGKANFIVTKPPQLNTSGWWLNTGRSRDQWHTMTRTGHIARLGATEAEPTVYLNQNGLDELAVKQGQVVQLTQMEGAGRFIAKAALDEGLTDHQLFMSMHWAGEYSGLSQVNKVVKAAFDPISGQPAFKSSQVNIEAIEIAHYGLYVGNQRRLFNADYCSLQREEQVEVWRYATQAPLNKQQINVGHGERVLTLDQEYGWIQLICRQQAPEQPLYIKAIHLVSTRPITSDYQALLNKIEQPMVLSEILALNSSHQTSRTVCSCMRVTDLHIKRALEEQQYTTLEEVQNHLKCGTNCGSCIPEVSKLISQHTTSQAIDVALINE